jgi:phospholipase C
MTMPNRAFVCAATSQGHLDDVTQDVHRRVDLRHAESGRGHVEDLRLQHKPLTKLNFPDTAAAPSAHFGRFRDFQADAKAGTLPGYAFLEPSSSSTGNSQHPNYNMPLGEQLLLDT